MMENVIEKHYVPTSGSGLDANLVAALMNNNNKSLDPESYLNEVTRYKREERQNLDFIREGYVKIYSSLLL